VEKWVELGEQSMAFRLASWRDQRAAQGDLEIAFDKDSSFMAFVSNKAISNRKTFAKQLREAACETNFADVRFLQALFEMTNRMHSPCLRLELLQYVLGLDNRYSIAHVKRSIELAATCMSISATI
jgi:ASC-1-like (ASCH) protein